MNFWKKDLNLAWSGCRCLGVRSWAACRKLYAKLRHCLKFAISLTKCARKHPIIQVERVRIFHRRPYPCNQSKSCPCTVIKKYPSQSLKHSLHCLKIKNCLRRIQSRLNHERWFESEKIPHPCKIRISSNRKIHELQKISPGSLNGRSWKVS